MSAQNQLAAVAAFEQVDRRQHPRDNQPARVKVRMKLAGADVDFQAVLVNSSRGGLAIRHWRKDLTLSSHVKVFFENADEVTARVKWNWINGPLVISGLERVHEAGSSATAAASNGKTPAFVHSKSRIVAGVIFAGLLIMLGWYLRNWIF
jgi:hypothetical protein